MKRYLSMALFIGFNVAYAQTSNIKLAHSYFLKALNLLNEHNDYTQSIEYANKSLKFAINSETYFVRARDYYFLGQYQDAMNDYNTCIKLFPKDPEYYLSRGQLKSTSPIDDYMGAIQDFNKGILLDTKDWNLYYSRGCAKKELGDNYGALEDFNKSIEVASDVSMVYYERGKLEYKMGNKQMALMDLSKAGELGDKWAYDEIKKINN